MSIKSEGLRGPRLAFVVREIPGKVKRYSYVAPPTKAQREKNPDLASSYSNTLKEIVMDAGYMVFLPTGNCYRLSAAELIKHGFDQEPTLMGYEQANDNKTAAGRFKLARTEQARQRAWRELEEEVIKHCVGRYGDYKSLIADMVPEGFVSDTEIAE